jgi:hypothetical protein
MAQKSYVPVQLPIYVQLQFGETMCVTTRAPGGEYAFAASVFTGPLPGLQPFYVWVATNPLRNVIASYPAPVPVNESSPWSTSFVFFAEPASALPESELHAASAAVSAASLAATTDAATAAHLSVVDGHPGAHAGPDADAAMRMQSEALAAIAVAEAANDRDALIRAAEDLAVAVASLADVGSATIEPVSLPTVPLPSAVFFQSWYRNGRPLMPVAMREPTRPADVASWPRVPLTDANVDLNAYVFCPERGLGRVTGFHTRQGDTRGHATSLTKQGTVRVAFELGPVEVYAYGKVLLLPAFPVKPAGVFVSTQQFAIGDRVKLADGASMDGCLKSPLSSGLVIGVFQEDRTPYKVVNLKTGRVSRYAEMQVVLDEDASLLGAFLKSGIERPENLAFRPMQLAPHRAVDAHIVECKQGHCMVMTNELERFCSECGTSRFKNTVQSSVFSSLVCDASSICDNCCQGLRYFYFLFFGLTTVYGM